jgi:DNA-binding winged helix-turn-helix (wHTH) protein
VARSSASSSTARTCSTTSVCRHSTPPSSRRGCGNLLWRTGRGTQAEIVEYGALVLNLETYQAALDHRPLDLTYMEYELLKFFSTHPGKVFTREQLLSRVWGYEYYGGARTVDVHVRRLRAKLGEEHANLIQTVRSVGYRLRPDRALRRAARPRSDSVRLGRRFRAGRARLRSRASRTTRSRSRRRTSRRSARPTPLATANRIGSEHRPGP